MAAMVVVVVVAMAVTAAAAVAAAVAVIFIIFYPTNLAHPSYVPHSNANLRFMANLCRRWCSLSSTSHASSSKR